MTFPAKSALRAVRVSGALSKNALSKLFKANMVILENPGRLINGILLDSRRREIDFIMAVYFKAQILHR